MAGIVVFCVSVLGVGVLVFVTLIAFSFSTLEINEAGLDYSGVTKSVEKLVYPPGIHFLGVGHSFIRFPSVAQTLEYAYERGANVPPIKSRTSDGLEVIVEVSFQYFLQPNKLYDLYMKYDEDYKRACEKIAIDVLTDSATNHTADKFFNDRLGISLAMQISLNKTFNQNCFASVEYFQLRSVDLPDKYEEAIQMTEVKRQDILKASAERQKVTIELETKVQQAKLAQQITINKASGDADAMLRQNEADLKILNMTIMSQAMSYGTLKQKLNYNDTQLLDYIRNKVIKEHAQDKIILSLD